jgi:hypothetical protein
MPYKLNPFTGKFDYYEAGSGSADLSTVLGNGNASGPNDIQFDATQGILFNNSSRLREGTIDALLGGSKGIAQICAVGYELKWEAGRLYVMDGNGIYIRWSLYNFTITPTITDDVTLGYLTGSRWSLDDGTTYVCTDNTTGAAVWEIQEVNYIDFNTAAAHIVAEGELAWNDANGTLDLGLKGGNTISNLGQHLHARVVNKTTPLVGLTKAGYEVVIVAGATGQRLSVKLAKADNDANSAGTLGIVCENIAGNQEGFICSVGQVTNINTTGSLQGETWADGDSLYLSGTTFGAITNVKPTAPIHEVRIGYVEYAHAVNGKIYVKIDNGYELDELHNVSINTGTLANNDVLTYESATSLWKNKPFTNPEGWNVIVLSANQDVINTIVPQDITEFQFSVVAGGHYMVEMDLCWSGNDASGDYQSQFSVTAGNMSAYGTLICSDQTLMRQITATLSPTASLSTFQLVSASIDFLMAAKANFNFYCTQNATFKFQVRNNAAAVGRISRTWKGSILKYKRID